MLHIYPGTLLYIPSSCVGNFKDLHSEKTQTETHQKSQHQMPCAYEFHLKTQKFLFVGTAPVKAILCYTTVKTESL